MFRRLKKLGWYNLSVSELLQNADEDLFHKMRRPQHHLLRVMDKLRERAGHLPEYTVIHKKSFIVRSLYSYI